MIPANDVYIDKNGNVTTDPKEYAIQVAAAGCHLDDRTARRYGISDALVSTMEPTSRRIVMGGLRSPKPATKTEPEPKAATPDATAPEPEADKAITEEPAEKAEAKTGAKKK